MSNADLPRVWFSGNDRAAINLYGLWLPRSVADLERLGGELREGLRVIIHEPGELEMEAILSYSPEFEAWVARGDEDTLVYYPEGNDSGT